jgi:transcription initiation factor TFIIF subunit alpha
VRQTGYGSGSETDSTRQKSSKKLTMPLKSHPGSPRDGTPSGTPSASRAGSPAPATLPTLDEVKAALPEEGIAITTLVKLFKGRVFKEQTPFFISLVKQAGKQDPITKMIHPKKD